MAYQPPASPDFAFSLEAYQPGLDFLFYPQANYPFIPPPTVVSFHQSNWDATQHQQSNLKSTYGRSLTRQTSIQQTSHQGTPVDAARLGLFWGRVAKQEIQLAISHGNAQPHQGDHKSNWKQPPAKEARQQESWDQSIGARDQQNSEQWQQATTHDKQQTEAFGRVDEYGPPFQYQTAEYLPPNASLLDFIFDGRRYTPANAPAVYFHFQYPNNSHAIQPRDRATSHGYSSNRIQDEPLRIPWGLGRKARDEDYTTGYGGTTEPLPPKQEPEQPDIRESYLLMNTISVVNLPERTSVELRDMEISLDIDSFSWAFQGELWGAASLAMVVPDSEGPKQIEVDINGWKWVFIIERYTSNRAFGQERYTVFGTSRTQLLAAPYAPLRSKSSSSDINTKQAITEELQNTGFTAEYPSLDDYDTPDWIIPGGSFSYQNQTAMQVVAKIASTAGSVIIPSRGSDTLSIQPRYPSSPWDWDDATMDNIIPASMVISLSANWRPEPQYNAVYVSGTHAGVAVNVKRIGSAGNKPAPDILEDWLTATQVNTERGRNELAKGGHQSIISLELPLTDASTAPGLVVPGRLVEVQDITGDWRALCLSVSISAEDGKVTQSVELERHY